MQKNLYFRQVIRRRNILGEAFFGLFLSFASYPRLLLEVFIRKNFGDRYFSLASVLTIIGFLIFVPYLRAEMAASVLHDVNLWDDIIMDNPTLYLFLSLFLLISIKRYQETKSGPSVFDFGRCSISSGDINPLFFKIQPFGKKPSSRLIETVYEPLFFLIIGWLLIKMDIAVGYLIFLSSIFYSLGYVGAYKRGDDFVKDKIDEMIYNQEMENAFVSDEENNKRGVRVRAERPSSREMRRDLADEFVVESVHEEAAEAF